MAGFGSVITAMITPFDESGALDVPLIAGSSTNDTRHAADLTGQAAASTSPSLT